MKKVLILFLLPFICYAQFVKSIKLKALAMRRFEDKDEDDGHYIDKQKEELLMVL
jgi:hypothetical protein